MSESEHTQRRFQRIPFTAQAHVRAANGDLHLNCVVVDVSLNGLLIKKPEGWLGFNGDQYQVDLLLNDAELVIKMQAEVAHIDNGSVGFHCELIDLDSITHLKRLVELNLGDEALLHRELDALLHDI